MTIRSVTRPDDLLLTILAIAILIGGPILYSSWTAKRRAAAFAATGDELGLTYHEGVTPMGLLGLVTGRRATATDEIVAATLAVRDMPEFPLLSIGRSHQIARWLEGTWHGEHIRVIDYRYTTGSGRSSSTHTWVLATRQCLGRSAPLTVTHRSMLSRLGHVVGLHGAETGDKAFDDVYRIDCHAPDFARDLFDERMRAYFLESGLAYRVEVANGALLCGVTDSGFSKNWADHLTEHVTHLLETLDGIAARVPDALRTDAPSMPSANPIMAPAIADS